MLVPFQIRHLSGFDLPFPSDIDVLKEKHYRVDPRSLTGDAPKQLLYVYEYGRAYRSRRNSWPRFIAKGGHKSYPNESLTEHFITRLGQVLNLSIADSRLVWIKKQIRFMSRHFHSEDQILVHGAEIFAGYLSQDHSFVKEVEDKGYSTSIFTFQVVETAITKLYPFHDERILMDLVRLLAFDAIVGNNDRHFVNWGVITTVSGRHEIRLAPIYDTARALLWNITEQNLQLWEDSHSVDTQLDAYIRRSKPKMGWDGGTVLNHFGLMQALATSNPKYKNALQTMIPATFLAQSQHLLNGEFKRLFSPLRAKIMLKCLRKRIALFAASVS